MVEFSVERGFERGVLIRGSRSCHNDTQGVIYQGGCWIFSARAVCSSRGASTSLDRDQVLEGDSAQGVGRERWTRRRV